MKNAYLAAATLAVLAATPALAEFELSAYGGYQTSPHSDLTGDVAGVPINKFIGWSGKPFAMPPYYGLRATYWKDNNTGWALEWTHAKVYAGADMAPEFSRLEFTDGLNLITVNYAKRWPGKWNNFTPYVSGGIGIALPHVDITPVSTGVRTYGYQLTGAAARLTAGASYDITDNWRAFGEYQFTVSSNTAELDGPGGGTLSTRIITNSLNIGISYAF